MPASVLQVSMSIGTLTSDDIGGVPPDGVFRQFITSGQVPVTPGDIEIHLNKQTISVGSTLSTDSELGASLISVQGGPISFTPLGGDISIVPRTERGANVPSTATVPPAGEPTALSLGDTAIIREGASYSLTGYGTGESQLLWFWFEPAETSATPSAGN